MKKCKHCELEFAPKQRTQLYCSQPCKKEAQRIRTNARIRERWHSDNEFKRRRTEDIMRSRRKNRIVKES